MASNLSGLKIRALRKQGGLTQGVLAGKAGISASYLNLIELNKRAVSGVLLDRIAASLGVERSLLDGDAERRVVESLDEVAADPVLSAGRARPGPAEELVGRQPGWAELILRLYRAYLHERQSVLALADRLNRDPFLGDSVHRILSSITAIRSAAEILQGGEALREEDRKRFTSIIGADSDRLTGTAQSLIAYFDNANMRVRSATPMEHVDAFIFEADNHFPILEDVAADFLRTMRQGETIEATAARQDVDQGDEDGGHAQSIETRRFLLTRTMVRDGAGEAAAMIVRDHAALGSDESRALAHSALLSYAAAAVLMPYEPFLEAAERRRYDLDALARLFGVSYEQAAHRLATLRRPGAEGVRFAFMRSDPSGYVTKRLPLRGLPLPRYGTACPLWPIYGAFQTPGAIARSFGQLPSGDEFLFFAKALEKRPSAPDRPRHLLSVMLACTDSEAGRVVYGDGIDRRGATVPVGTICRLCVRSDCDHRQEPPLIT